MGLAVASLVVSAIGTGMAVFGQIKAGRAAKKAGEASAAAATEAAKGSAEVAESVAGLSEYNAEVAELQKQDAIERGAVEESRFRTQIRSVIGAQRAGQAAGNIDVSFGSAVDVQADAAFLGEMDALQIRTNAAREAWGYSVQAEDYRRRADISRLEGANALRTGVANAAALRAGGSAAQSQGYWGAASSLIGGTGSLLQMAYGFQQSRR